MDSYAYLLIGIFGSSRSPKIFYRKKGIRLIQLDGNPLPGHLVPLVDDNQTHEVRVEMG